MKRRIIGVAVLVGLFVPRSAPAEDAAAAGREGKYVFVLFHKEEDEATRAMRQTLQAALAKRGDRATVAQVSVGDPAHKAMVDRYGVARSPMPLVLAIAPNGAVTGGFAVKLTEKDVASAFVSPGQAACMKVVQARKLVLLCVQRESGGSLPQGVRDFQADPRYGPVTEVVTLRATDAAEAGFLQALQIKADAPMPMTALLAPPGRLLRTFPASVTKQQLVECVTSPQGCCPGGKCCPGGCCGKP
jgi:hypothetical protein